jgi:hypothetical protein
MASSRSSVHSNESAHGPLPLYGRLLFPATTVLPLFLTPSLHERCDDALYQLIALVCREHVLPWYSRLTRDRTFLHEVTRIVTHVVQVVEARLAAVDLAALIAVDLPVVLERHYCDSHAARAAQGTAYSGGLDYRALFHSLQPHAGIDLDSPSGSKLGVVSAAYLSNLVDGVLALCLPPEDVAAETERAVVREVIVYVILAGVFARVAQPWFVHQQIVKLLAKGKPAEVATPRRPIWLAVLVGLVAAVNLVVALGSAAMGWVAASGWRDPPVEADLVRPSVNLLRTVSRAEERPIAAQALWLFDVISGLSDGVCDRYVGSFPGSWRPAEPLLARSVGLSIGISSTPIDSKAFS